MIFMYRRLFVLPRLSLGYWVRWMDGWLVEDNDDLLLLQVVTTGSVFVVVKSVATEMHKKSFFLVKRGSNTIEVDFFSG